MEQFNKKYPRVSKYIRYGGNALRIAHQAYNMAKVVASVVNSEKKYYDYASPTINPDTTAQFYHLTGVSQGDGKEQRIGDSIALKSLQVEGYITYDFTQPQEMVRIMIVRENENARATQPSITDILESTSVISFRNKDYPKRFKTLYDKVFTCDDIKKNKMFSYYKQFKMLKDRKGNPTVARHITWNNDATDAAKGHMWLIVIGNVATASTASTALFNSRLRFMDN